MTASRMTSPELADWLSQVEEDILDPSMPICDPHHHNWERPGSRYLLDDLHADTSSGHRVVSTVFVECMAGYRESGPEEERSLGETEMVAELARRSSRRAAEALEAGRSPAAVIAGIVGFVDLTLGDEIRPLLAEHARLGEGRFRGIRHAAGWDASPEVANSHTNPPRDLYALPSFRRGVDILGELDLVCETWQYHTQLGGRHDADRRELGADLGLAALARACPGTTFVLDHCGGPIGIGPYAAHRTTTEFDGWRRGVDAVAACPNVVVKLGGITMPRNGFDFHRRTRPPGSEEYAAAIEPWIRHCLEAFGAERAMFESNFPVDKVSVSYPVLWNAFKRLVAQEDETTRRALLHDNAVRVYRLDAAGPATP